MVLGPYIFFILHNPYSSTKKYAIFNAATQTSSYGPDSWSHRRPYGEDRWRWDFGKISRHTAPLGKCLPFSNLLPRPPKPILHGSVNRERNIQTFWGFCFPSSTDHLRKNSKDRRNHESGQTTVFERGGFLNSHRNRPDDLINKAFEIRVLAAPVFPSEKNRLDSVDFERPKGSNGCHKTW